MKTKLVRLCGYFLSAVSLFFCCSIQSLLAQESLQAESPRRETNIVFSQINPNTAIYGATPDELAEAMDVNPDFFISAELVGEDRASATPANLGVIKPQQGTNFALLSSGIAGTTRPEPGTNFGTEEDSDGDKVQLTLTLEVPDGVNRLGFAYNFLSAEYPDFINTEYDDTFLALLEDSNGLREIARASVNSSVFAPVSNELARGSGFDIFTEDPAEVDTEFGSGLPDAGITGYEFVNTPIAGGRFSLTFLVEDKGDGILDSAAIIDSLLLSSIERIDPFSKDREKSLIEGGQIVSNIEKLAVGGEAVQGVATDGVTKILLRNKVSSPGSVEFCLPLDGYPKNGYLSNIGSEEESRCVTSVAQETQQGYYSFAVYRVPINYNSGDDAQTGERDIDITATYESDNTENNLETSVKLRLVRPPVILIHGIWSNGGTWSFPLIKDSRFNVYRADYESTNAHRFIHNARVPYQNEGEGIKQALSDYRNKKNIAVTQVDLIGHSMGGILSRYYIASEQYLTESSFNSGNVHSLLTLNTPHLGTPLANLLVQVRDELTDIDDDGGIVDRIKRKIAICSSTQNIGMPVCDGAVDDLAVGSDAINVMNETPIPSHALVGVGGSTVAGAVAPKPFSTMQTLINFFADYVDPLQNLQHDFIVGRNSQEGGLPESAYTVFSDIDSIHCCVPPENANNNVTESVNYSNRIIELYNLSIDDPIFAQFPAPSTLQVGAASQTKITPYNTIDTTNVITSAQLSLTVLENSVSSGDTITVRVEPLSEITITKVLVVGLGIAEQDLTAPFELEIDVPIEAAGEFKLFAIGETSSEDYVTSTDVPVQITSEATLQEITIFPQNIALSNIGDTTRLSIFGEYSDNVIREIQGLASLEYLVSDPDILSVSEDGVVTALQAGITTVVVRLGEVQDSISVQVVLSNATPLANAGTDISSMIGSLITLDGNASSDPDNGPLLLTYEWIQISGPVAILSSSKVPAPIFTPTEPGTYIFNLVVRDGQSDSLPDTVIVEVTVNPEGTTDLEPMDEPMEGLTPTSLEVIEEPKMQNEHIFFPFMLAFDE